MSSARICELVIGGSRANWAQVGINFSHDGVFAIGEIALRIDESLPPGMHSWVLSNIDSTIVSIDGISTSRIVGNGQSEQHDAQGFVLTQLGIDHVVVNTPD